MGTPSRSSTFTREWTCAAGTEGGAPPHGDADRRGLRPMTSVAAVRTLKAVAWLGALAPGAWLALGVVQGTLGPNPIERLTHVTGMTALVLLLVTLAVTPVRRITGWNPVIQLRRLLGLLAFFYAVCHLVIWFVFDMVGNWRWMLEDVAQRPYITVGFASFLLLAPLALTSTRGWIRRLGKRWGTLHRLVYPATALAIVHYFWLVKSDVRLPTLLAVCFGVLMLARWLTRRGAPSARSGRGAESRSAAT